MNRIKTNLVIALAILLISGFTGVSFGQEFFVKDEVGAIKGPKYTPGEIIVKFKRGVSNDVIRQSNQRHGTSVLSISRRGEFMRLKIPKNKTVEAMVAIYSKNPNVEYAEPNYIANTFLYPNDPLYSYQWHMDNAEYGGINMESVSVDKTGGDPSIIVAVIDTGVAYEDYAEFIDNPGIGKDYWITYQQAPDLENTNFEVGYDFVNDDAHPNDDQGHGTHVTGTIAQSTNNGIGVAGVAFNTSIMPIKVLDKNGSGTYADIADGIYFAAAHSANIINMSLGGASDSITLKNALAYAYNSGVTIVCASGNDGSPDTISYPAAYDSYCIAVGATRYDETIAAYSNRGPSLDLVAPGGDINIDQNGDGYGDGILQQTFSIDPTNFGYWFYQGTSMAAPHVSGVAALLIANAVAITPDEVREALQLSAKDKGISGWDADYGWGIVDACAALNYYTAATPNNPPVADAGPDQAALVGAEVTFNGSDSYDIDDGIAIYDWDFGDETAGIGETTTHVYSTAGTYTVTLTVTDAGGLTGKDTAEVTITEESSLIAIHITEIAMSTKKAGPNVNAIAAITLTDADNAVIEDATVSGTWRGLTDDTDSGITDANGTVLLNSDEVKRNKSGIFTFTVTDITKDGCIYNSSANAETSDSIDTP